MHNMNVIKSGIHNIWTPYITSYHNKASDRRKSDRSFVDSITPLVPTTLDIPSVLPWLTARALAELFGAVREYGNSSDPRSELNNVIQVRASYDKSVRSKGPTSPKWYETGYDKNDPKKVTVSSATSKEVYEIDLTCMNESDIGSKTMGHCLGLGRDPFMQDEWCRNLNEALWTKCARKKS
jgi:hypothetical protein